MGYRRRGLMKTIIIISDVNMTKRLRLAEEKINWAPETWNMFIFCDKCSVVIRDKKRVYCWRQLQKIER